MANPWDNDPIVTPAPWTNDPIVAPAQPQHPVAGPSGSTMTDLGREAGTVGANVLGGLLSFPHLPAQGIDWLGRQVGVDVGADAALSSIPDPSDPTRPLVPDYGTARNMAFNTTGGTEYQPQSYLGRRAMDAATAGAMTLATGNPAAIPAAMGAGATGGAAAEAFPDHPVVAGLIGGLPGGVAGSAIANTGQRLVGAVTNAQPNPTYAAFQRQGLPTNLAGTTTGNPSALFAEKFAARMPGSEGAIADAQSDLQSAWQARLNAVADRMGTAATPAEAGQALQTDAANWLTNFKQRTGQLWSDFKSQVPGTTPTPVANYQQTLTDLLGSFPGAGETGKVLRPASLQSLSDALGVDLKGGSSLPWDAVQNIRTAIGEKIENPSTIADTSQAALRRLYGALSQDMQAGAGSVSQQALSAFHRANTATAAGHDLLDGYLNPILKADSPEKATQYAMAQARLGGDRLGAITFNLPTAAGELGSYALRNAATNTDSPTSFATAIAGRKPVYSPEARNVLFPQPGTQADITDLATTGHAMQPAMKDLANSPTATHQTRGLGSIMLAAEMARQGHEMFGVPGAIGGGLLGLATPMLAGRAAQLTAQNPLLSRYLGQQLPLAFQQPTLANRLMMGNRPGQ